jgi:two-component system response regulator BaeR
MLVEDEVELAELVRDYLLHEGYEVEMHHRGDGIVAAVRQTPPDMILLDLMLPGTDGLTICREVRRFSEVPIIMVTARVDEIDRLLGLDLGADDYICKPFKPREVVARVKAVLRRTHFGTVKSPEEGLQLDPESYTASVDGNPLTITTAEFRLLATLHAKPGRVFSRQELLDAIYDDYREVGDRSVDSHVKNLRRKLAEHMPEGDPIHSVYGVGYKLEW